MARLGRPTIYVRFAGSADVWRPEVKVHGVSYLADQTACVSDALLLFSSAGVEFIPDPKDGRAGSKGS